MTFTTRWLYYILYVPLARVYLEQLGINIFNGKIEKEETFHVFHSETFAPYFNIVLLLVDPLLLPSSDIV